MANTPIIVTTQAPQKNEGATEIVIKGLFVVGAIYFGNKVYKEWRANRASDKTGGDPNVQAATEIHQAIDGAGTSEGTLFKVANRNLNWQEVSKAYRKLFNSQMLDDIKSDLSPTDYQKFLNIYNGSNATTPPVKSGEWIYVEKSVNVRKTPKVTGTVDQVKNFGKTNIIGLAPAGKYIGVATGRFSRDIDTKESTLFYEIKMGVLNTNNKHDLVNAWVAASQVRIEPNNTKVGSNLTYFKKSSYENALGLGSIGANTNYNAELQTNSPVTAIYDTTGKLIAYANSKGVVLGKKEAELSKNGDRFYIFKNIQGLTRMALVEQVKEVAL